VAEAEIELYVSDTLVPCTVGDLGAGLPTVLDEMTIDWGRQSMWEQPDAGGCTFRIHAPTMWRPTR